jgi:small-conductance mechanosensitive channel/CRP-like cAMP-binding protein
LIRSTEVKTILPPLVLLILFVLAEMHGEKFISMITRDVHLGLRTGIWLAGGWLLNRLIHVFFWERREHKLRGSTAPALLQHVVTIFLAAVTLATLAYFVFGLPVTGFWATSSVVGLVLGVALRSLIADFFSGIALEMDPPFKIGDFIELRKPGYDPLVGQVVEVNWRATQIRPRGQICTVYVPNSELSALLVNNIYTPLNKSRFEVVLPFDLSLPVDRTIRILTTAALTSDLLLADPAPEVLVNRFTNAGAEYKIRYWLAPETSPDIARHNLLAKVHTQLRYAGIQTGAERSAMVISPKPELITDPDLSRGHFLSRIPFFEKFRRDELEKLAACLRIHHVSPKTAVMKAGESGDSMFLVGEGLLEAHLQSPNGSPIRAGRLAAGEIFGEMSLLTGEPRAATVTTITECVLYEMTRDDIQDFVSRPEVAEHITHVAAKRHAKNERLLQAAHEQEPTEDEHRLLVTQILARMRSFFAFR